MSSARDSISRLLHYGKRHGLRGVLSRAGVAFKRMRMGNRMVLFACDLRELKTPADELPSGSRVERINAEVELNEADRRRIVDEWNPEITQRLLTERFARKASLWLWKIDGKLAAYGWTMIGGTIGPHYFSVGANDAHFFDFFVYAEFRGRRINPLLANHILTQLQAEGRERAFIEAAEWNAAQLSSLQKTPFKQTGHAQKA